jgi:predicted RND superfamily exporter protein
MKKKKTFFSRHGMRIMLSVFFLLPFCLLGARRALLSNTNNVEQWLPEVYEETATFKWFQKHFAGEQFILLSWEGCTLDDQRLELLTRKLMPPDDAKPEMIAPTEPALLQRWMAPVYRMLGYDDKAAQPTEEPRYFSKIITGPKIIERLTAPPLSLSREEAIDRLKGSIIGPDLNKTCAVLTLSEAGKRNRRVTVGKVRAVAKECNIKPQELHMGGPPVDNVAIDEAGEKSLFRLAGLAGTIGLIVSWWCLRSPRLIVMVFFAGIYSAAGSLAVVWYTGSTMNAILLTMPSLVYVATISGAIHLSNYYRDSIAENGTTDGAPERSIAHAALPLCLATGTTAVGLLSLCYSELVPIQLFGLYSAVGVVFSMLLLFFFMPSAFQLWPLKTFVAAKKEEDEEEDEPLISDPMLSPHWRKVGRFIINHHTLVSLSCLAVMGFCGWGMTRIETSVHLMRLFSGDAPILADYRWLESNLGALVPMEVVIHIDPQVSKLNFLERMELIAEIQKRVESVNEVKSSLSAVKFAPKLPEKLANAKQGGMNATIARTRRKVFSEKLEEHRDEYLKEDYLAEENGEELWRISGRVGALTNVDYGLFVHDLRAEVDPFLEKKAAEGLEGVHATYTGLVPLVYKAQRSLLDGLEFGFVTDFLLISLVMMIAVRDWSAGPLLMLPSVFPVVVVFGIMGWMGIVVDIGTVMAPSVALGVTVDDVVHFMLKYRKGLKNGLNRGDAIMEAYEGCARAMYQSWGVIGLGLAVFALSPFTPTQRFGYLMCTLLTAALFGNLLLLPALLAGPFGKIFGRRLLKAQAAETLVAEAKVTESVIPAPNMVVTGIATPNVAAPSLTTSNVPAPKSAEVKTKEPENQPPPAPKGRSFRRGSSSDTAPRN